DQALRLAEGEGEGLGPRVEERDRKGAVFDGAFLADQLIEALAGYHSRSLGVGVGARVRARCLAVEGYAKAYRLAGRRAHDQVEVAGVEAEADLRAGRERARALALVDPLALERP